MLGVHIGRINRRIKLDIVNYIIQFLDFRHIINQVRKIERLQRPCFGVFNHTDCPAGVYEQYAWL